ncbi:MAG: thiamine-phosphate kinase, partial [Nitrospinota bacterium]|nr:thiamine-phosphate kinase [Nitrospinota bacterium]
RRYFERSAAKSQVALGIGDDCASIIPTRGHEVLLSTDTLAEAVHFLRELSKPEEVGAKAIFTSASDIAAMGGKVVGFLLSINLHEVDRKWLQAFLGGAGKAAWQCGGRILGGNVSVSASLSFTVTVIGEVKKNHRVDRSGAKPGDLVYVTGYPGESALGLDILMSGKKRIRPAEKKLVQRHTRPTPRLKWGALLAEGRIASSMIDISDGVALDFRRILKASGAGGVINLDGFPISGAVKLSQNGENKTNLLKRMITGGEDYELLFTVNPRKTKKLETLIKEEGIKAHRIGEITAQKGTLEIFGEDGKKLDFLFEGWLHS